MYSDKELLKYLKMLTWDTTLTEHDLLKLLRSGEDEVNHNDLNTLYIKILNWFSWHKVRRIIPHDKLKEALADTIISGLFPRPLRDKYRYVRSLL